MSSGNGIFEDIAQKWFEDARSTKPSETPPILYHYTDARGLEGTLKSSKVWVTEYRFLNDSTELTHAKSILLSIVDERKESKRKKNYRQLYESTLEWSGRQPVDTAFIFSLTARKDDLSQWRGYANEGSGFSIGFSGADLFKLSETMFDFAKVCYSEGHERRVLETALDEIEALFDKAVVEQPEKRADLADLAGKAFDYIAYNRAAYVKHPSFASEDEWRIIVWLDRDDVDIKARVSGSRIVPYYELGATISDKLPIKEIGVGPGFSGAEVVDAVRYLTASHGYKPDIYSAKTPYRRP